MFIQAEYTWYTTPKYHYWFRAILGRFSNKTKQIPRETWTHPPISIVISDFWNFFLCKAPKGCSHKFDVWCYFVYFRTCQTIYTIVFLKSVCQRSQTAGRNSCSIVSGNVSNCSHRLTVYPVTSSRLNSAWHFFPTRKTLIKLSRRAVLEQVSIEWPSDGGK